MTEGPILKKLVKFMLPLCIINVVQMLYNAIDVAILGNFAGDDAVAAVGAAGSLSYILTGLFQGLGGGVNVVVSRAVGAKDIDRARRATGTALLTGIVCGLILLAVVGFSGYVLWDGSQIVQNAKLCSGRSRITAQQWKTRKRKRCPFRNYSG